MNKLISSNEYQKIYRTLNNPTQMTHYMKKGALMMYCNGKLVMTKQEMANYKDRETSGERFFYSLQFVPAKNINMMKSSGGYTMRAQLELHNYA